MIKNILRSVTPPFLWESIKVLKALVATPPANAQYGWFGNYQNFQSARDASIGYDQDPGIVELVSKITEEEKANYSKFPIKLIDRNSILTTCITHCILNMRLENTNIVDFGGALGQHYFRVRKSFPSNHNFNWTVIETKPMVEKGNSLFANNELSFHSSFDDINGDHSILHISGTLQCIEDPIELLEKAKHKNYEYVIIDRFPLVPFFEQDRICIQKVKYINDTSYPSRFFSKKWEEIIYNLGEIVYRWETPDGYSFDDRPFRFSGFLIKLNH